MSETVATSQRIRAAAGRLGAKLPSCFGALPYRLSLLAFRLATRWIFRSAPPEVWVRNSFALGTLQPLFSDLDLTLWFEAEPPRPQLDTLWRWQPRLRRLFPLLGETNVYWSSQAQLACRAINPWELARDQRLREKLSTNLQPKFTAAAAFVFLLRMLDSDRTNLRHFPDLRLRKWNAHFREVSRRLQPPSRSPQDLEIPGLTDQITARIFALLVISPLERDEGMAWLGAFLRERELKVPLHETRLELQKRPWAWVLFPHRFCFLPPPGDSLPAPLAEVLLEQIRWEIFGVATQLQLNASHQTTRRHLEGLGKCLKMADHHPAAPETRTLLQELLRRLDTSLRTGDHPPSVLHQS